MKALERPNPRVCIIGAGPSGVTAAKNLLQAGLTNVVVYEKAGEVGGNWLYSDAPGSHSSVYETTFMISSKRLSQFDDFPMPESYPDYPSHAQILRYIQDYARHFGVLPYIRYNSAVAKAELLADAHWRIHIDGGSSEEFDYLIVANGHHSVPRMPELKGSFSGEIIHSHDYKRAAPFAGKRVLVIGGGNSACDIAVEVSRVAATTAISLRRGYYVWPKFILGMPTDVFNSVEQYLPMQLNSPLARLTNYICVGSYKSYGLQPPKHGPYQQHPILNSELLTYIGHGRIQPRRDLDHFDGFDAYFRDGVVEPYDSVIACTGFRISHPFLDSSLADYAEGDVPLYLRIFHPACRRLLFIGLIQPQGCLWTLADWQSRLAAQYVLGRYELPQDLSRRIADDVGAIRRSYYTSARHTIEVDYYRYRRALQRELRRASRTSGLPAIQGARLG